MALGDYGGLIQQSPLRDAYRLTSDVGPRRRFRTQTGKLSSGQHDGVDLAAPVGTNVYAATDGQVVFAGPRGGYGNLVVVRNPATGVHTLYAHLQSALVRPGQTIKAGQHIAELGNTGNSTGPHLDFRVWKDGHSYRRDGTTFRAVALPGTNGKLAAPTTAVPAVTHPTSQQATAQLTQLAAPAAPVVEPTQPALSAPDQIIAASLAAPMVELTQGVSTTPDQLAGQWAGNMWGGRF